jgi:hypothetical protein
MASNKVPAARKNNDGRFIVPSEKLLAGAALTAFQG